MRKTFIYHYFSLLRRHKSVKNKWFVDSKKRSFVNFFSRDTHKRLILKNNVDEVLSTKYSDSERLSHSVLLKTIKNELKTMSKNTDLFERLLRSYPSRLAAVRAAKGKATDYWQWVCIFRMIILLIKKHFVSSFVVLFIISVAFPAEGRMKSWCEIPKNGSFWKTRQIPIKIASKSPSLANQI